MKFNSSTFGSTNKNELRETTSMSVAALGAYSFPLGPLQFTPSSPVGAPPVGPPVLLHSRNVRPPEENESFPLKGEEDSPSSRTEDSVQGIRKG